MTWFLMIVAVVFAVAGLLVAGAGGAHMEKKDTSTALFGFWSSGFFLLLSLACAFAAGRLWQ